MQRGESTLGTLDTEELREKYRAERDKRLRPDGPDQYLEPAGRFAHLLEDPYAEVQPREPVDGDVTVAIIGGGFAGLTTGARLYQAGITDVTIIETGGDFGGVWYWNRYPGAMCDTASMVYLPLLEETGYMPTQKYTAAPENYAHAQRIGRTFDLYEQALFSTEVTSLRWDDEASRWEIRTNRGDRVRARFVAMGTGPIARPKLPGIDGIESFGGHAFHTARWDYDYTGGDWNGAPMVGLGDKRVGIIGTGATAVQCIPHLAAASGELLVFQRTPSSIDVRNNRPLDPAEFAALDAGWQREWCTNFATLQTGGFAEHDHVMDGWTDIAIRIRDRIVERVSAGEEFTPALITECYEACDDDKMNEIRARVIDVVDDPATASALQPWYRQLCKRPCFHDEYLAAYNLPGTRLIDTDGRGVERIDAAGVWANGEHHELDVLIFASGFEVNLAHTANYETVGRDGETLTDHWADGVRTMHGVHVAGFPNLFLLGLSQGGNLISNVTHNLTDAATTVAAVVAEATERGVVEVELRAAAEQRWIDSLDAESGSLLRNPECTPGYYNNEGRPPTGRDRLNGARYPAGPVAFFELTERWRNSGEFDGLRFGPRTS